MSDEPGEAVVYRLADDCTIDDVTEGALYVGTVDAVVEYGIFVELAPAVSGLAHESNLDGSYDVGDEVLVELAAIKENGDLGFVPTDVESYEIQDVEHEYEPVPISDLDDHEGESVHLDGEIVQVKQTGGPTLFHVSDGTGVVPCAAFESAGQRAYPETAVGDHVHVIGHAERRGDGLQIETDAIDVLEGSHADDLRQQLDSARSDPEDVASFDPLIEWDALASHSDDIEAVARRLAGALLNNRPVVLRHHADTDGMCAAIPLERALESFVERTHWSPDAPRHLVKRFPSKAPFYEVEDATRDLNKALENRDRHGQKLPLLVMIDNGSTAEDVPAYKHLDTYDVPVVVIDHHSPDPDAVEPYVEEHVNPYLHGEDYRITSGMLCVELVRLLDPSLSASVEHVPAVAGLADRSGADAMIDYLDLAAESGYHEADLHAIGDALDYAAHWLRHGAGRGVVDDVLGLTDGDRHKSVVELLASGAEDDIETQLDAALPHVESERLSNGVTCYQIDVENHAHRFTYPAPGTTTGAIHDHMVRETDEPAITIGYGPDFAVLRSDGVRLDIPEMVTTLNEELRGAGVSGGGHLVVGSIKFVEGMREQVLDALLAEMADAEIDESLGAAAPRVYGSRDD